MRKYKKEAPTRRPEVHMSSAAVYQVIDRTQMSADFAGFTGLVL